MTSKTIYRRSWLIFLMIAANVVFVAGKLLPLNDKNTSCNVLNSATIGIYKEVVKTGETIVSVNFQDIRSCVEKKNYTEHQKYTFYNIKIKDNITAIYIRDRSLITLSSYRVHSPEALDKILKKIQFFSINNPSLNTLLVDLSNDLENKIIPKYFKVLWQNHCIRPIIIKKRANSIEEIVDIYRWPSLAPSSQCGTNAATYRKVGYYIPKNNTFTFFKFRERFFNMIPPKMVSECQLKVNVVIYPPFIFPPTKRYLNNKEIVTFDRGYEIKLINTLAESFGLKIKFKVGCPLTWGSLEANGSATGIYKDLINGDTDIAISSLTFIPRYNFVDFGIPYSYEDMIWCVPKPIHLEPWTSLLHPYKLEIFILYQLTFILTSITLCLLSKRNGEPQHNQSLDNCIFRCAADIYGNTYSAYTPKNHIVRIFYIVWLVFTVHMTVLYTGLLFSKLTLRWEDHRHLTHEDILNSDLRLLVFSHTESYITDSNAEMKKVTSRKFSYCLNLPMCLEMVAVTGDSAICLTSSMSLFAKQRQWAIACQKQAKLVSFPVTLIFRKHYYLRNEMNQKIFKLFEAGLIDHWKNEAISSYRFPENGQDFYNLDKTAYPTKSDRITFMNIKAVFGILIAGHLFACGVFLIELVVYYRRMYDKHKSDAEAAYIGFNN